MAAVRGLDTSNYPTSAGWLDGESGDTAGTLLEVEDGSLGLRPSSRSRIAPPTIYASKPAF